MRVRPGAVAALALLAAASAARADIVLNGSFHTGDEDGDTRPEFTPLDPVACARYRANPTRFHLTEDATITGFILHDPIDVNNNDITIDLDGTPSDALTCVTCGLCSGTTPCADITVTLTSSVVLPAGDHTVAVVDPSGASSCDNGNDFGWSKLTLQSTAETTTIVLAQHRHIGDTDDTDDDYETSDLGNPFYPDAQEGDPISQSFTLTEARRLTEVRLNRLRDLDVSDAQVRVNGTFLGNLPNITNSETEAEPTTVTTSLLLAAGTHTVSVDAGDLGPGNVDDFSWDGIQLRFAGSTTSGTPGFFNAVDVGGNVLTGSIQTKVAGATYTLDLYALTGFGSGQDSTYNGGASVEVLDAADNSGAVDVYGCRSSWFPAVQSLGSVIFVGGTAQVTGPFLDAGLKEARIKVTDLTTGASGCSLDNFAIRPASFSVVPSQGSDTTAGTATPLTNAGTSGLPRHRAGQPFTIIATAMSANNVVASNYTANPEVVPTAVAPATTTGSMNTPTWTAVSGGVRRTDNAQYREVGPVSLAVTDSTWADVDADDTPTGRSFTGSVTAGRFVPDHFKVTEGTLAPACPAGGFSYLGSTLDWATPAVTLTAESADDPLTTGANEAATTMNYEGALEKLPATLSQPTYALPAYAALAGSLDPDGLDAAPTISNAAAGVAYLGLPSLKFVRSLVGAFDAEIQVTLPAFMDEDDTPPAESPIVLGALAAGGGVAFSGGAKSQRFGRLYFEPRYGSELMPMDVPLRAEYFDGVSFVHNAADACTSVAATDITFLPAAIGQTHSVTSNGDGSWRVTLTAPNDAGTATMTVSLPVNPGLPHALLLSDSDGNGTYTEDPAGSAVFGVHAQDDRRIYQREVVGN